jgi:hypothetical protein
MRERSAKVTNRLLDDLLSSWGCPAPRTQRTFEIAGIEEISVASQGAAMALALSGRLLRSLSPGAVAEYSNCREGITMAVHLDERFPGIEVSYRAASSHERHHWTSSRNSDLRHTVSSLLIFSLSSNLLAQRYQHHPEVLPHVRRLHKSGVVNAMHHDHLIRSNLPRYSDWP